MGAEEKAKRQKEAERLARRRSWARDDNAACTIQNRYRAAVIGRQRALLARVGPTLHESQAARLISGRRLTEAELQELQARSAAHNSRRDSPRHSSDLPSPFLSCR